MERQRNEISVGKEILEKVVGLWNLWQTVKEAEASSESLHTVDGPPMFSMTIAVALDESTSSAFCYITAAYL